MRNIRWFKMKEEAEAFAKKNAIVEKSPKKYVEEFSKSLFTNL